MSRKNIFQQIAQKKDFQAEVCRIDELMKNKNGIRVEKLDFLRIDNLDVKFCSIVDFADMYSFKRWSHRGTSISCSDMQSALGLGAVANWHFEFTQDQLFSYIEYILNLLYIVKTAKLPKGRSFTLTDVFYVAEENVHNVMGWLNYEARVFEKQQRVMIYEKDQAVTAVAEVVDEDSAYSMIQYNHHSLIGEIEKKRSILVSLGKELEPKRRELSNINKKLEVNIFFMLNNMSIRHNNTVIDDKNYKAIVASMSNKELEYWYDELFQMQLLAFLELNHVKRHEEVEEIKARIVGGESE